MERSWLPGGFRSGFFDDPVASGRISCGGVTLMKKSVLSAMVVLLLLGVAAYAAFFVAPTDAKQGVIYRILYLHVASAWTGLTSFFICFIANSLYVLRRQPRWDWLGVSAGETGLVFTTVVLLTGPIWAHPVWGIWWTWDARLTSTFVLWLLYVSYLLLRTLVEEPDRRALLSALFGIFAFIDVPLVFGSIRWWRTQHPQPIIMGAPGAGLDPTMYRVLFFTWLAMLGLMTLLLRQRYRLEAMRGDLEIIQRELEAA
ncbi:MAG: cytochrome C assembly protein [Acidobacteria bacterium]|nr:MAG: cytochrome C assembly protein [Acidobacteriota bacterium]PYU57886.1 MAG: cytochrome C assembly protein [Acidobacteriota bacterium]PYU71112.1 MAG: cytochrome C assembly protein [Acidobacteriota bacterium]